MRLRLNEYIVVTLSNTIVFFLFYTHKHAHTLSLRTTTKKQLIKTRYDELERIDLLERWAQLSRFLYFVYLRASWYIVRLLAYLFACLCDYIDLYEFVKRVVLVCACWLVARADATFWNCKANRNDSHNNNDESDNIDNSIINNINNITDNNENRNKKTTMLFQFLHFICVQVFFFLFFYTLAYGSRAFCLYIIIIVVDVVDVVVVVFIFIVKLI